MVRTLLLSLLVSWQCYGALPSPAQQGRCARLVGLFDEDKLSFQSLREELVSAPEEDSVAHFLFDSVLFGRRDTKTPYSREDQRRYRDLLSKRIPKKEKTGRNIGGTIGRVILEVEWELAQKAVKNATDKASQEYAEALLDHTFLHAMTLLNFFDRGARMEADDAGIIDAVAMRAFAARHHLRGGQVVEGEDVIDGIRYPFLHVTPETVTELGKVATKLAARQPPARVMVSSKTERKFWAKDTALLDSDGERVGMPIEKAYHQDPELLARLLPTLRAVGKMNSSQSPLDIRVRSRNANPNQLLEWLAAGSKTVLEWEDPVAAARSKLFEIRDPKSVVGQERDTLREIERWIARVEGTLTDIDVAPTLKKWKEPDNAFTVVSSGAKTLVFDVGREPRVQMKIVVWPDGTHELGLATKDSHIVVPVKETELREYFDVLVPIAAKATDKDTPYELNGHQKENAWALLVAAKRRLEVQRALSQRVLGHADALAKAFEEYAAAPSEASLAKIRALRDAAPTGSWTRSTLRGSVAPGASRVPDPNEPTPQFSVSALLFQKKQLAEAKDHERTQLVGELGIHAIHAYARKEGWKFRDRSNDNVGYDVELTHPKTGRVLRIEVKAHGEAVDTFTVTRPEILSLQNNPSDSFVAIVEVANDGSLSLHLRQLQPGALDPEEAGRTYRIGAVLARPPQSLASLR